MASLLSQRLRGLSPRLARLSSTVPKYSELMEKTGRPISPHVMIYAFPTIAISSIMVRATGIALTAGTAGIAFMSLDDSYAPAAYMEQLASSSLAAPAKFCVAFPLTYHYLGAARHAVWDKKGWGFTNQSMLHSSYALLGASALLSLGLAAYSLPSKKKES